MLPTREQRIDRLGAMLLRTSGLISASIVLLVVGFLLWRAWPAFTNIGAAHFALDEDWSPSAGRFDLTAMAATSVATTLGAIALAGPLGIGSALFSRFYAPPPLAAVYRRLVELLAGIPSVIYGFWGLVTLVPLLARWRGSGASLLAATLVLTLMILPTVALLTEAALASVPGTQRQGAAALGLGTWVTLRRVILPAALPGIVRALLLAAMRAVGETMAVLMVSGNVVRFPGDPFAAVRALTSNIALEMGYAYGDHQSALFFSGLVLLALVAGGVVLADWVALRQHRDLPAPGEHAPHV